MGTLYFKANNGEKRLIKEEVDEKFVEKIIKNYLNISPKYEIFYIRAWKKKDEDKKSFMILAVIRNSLYLKQVKGSKPRFTPFNLAVPEFQNSHPLAIFISKCSPNS